MKIVFKKSFVKQYAKLDANKRLSVDETIRVFILDPKSPQLKNHALKGKLTDKRAISAAFNLRIVLKCWPSAATTKFIEYLK